VQKKLQDLPRAGVSNFKKISIFFLAPVSKIGPPNSRPVSGTNSKNIQIWYWLKLTVSKNSELTPEHLLGVDILERQWLSRIKPLTNCGLLSPGLVI